MKRLLLPLFLSTVPLAAAGCDDDEWIDALLAGGTPVAEDGLRAMATIAQDDDPQFDSIPLQPVPALTALRDSYLAGEHGDWWYGFLPMVDADGTIYELYFRDECPLEDARGLIRLEPYDTDGCVGL
jgi:hypothetical protein